MASYIQLDAAEFEKFMLFHRFARSESGDEIVYVRHYTREGLDENINIEIKVYSSIRIGRTVGRAVGTDAVRVVAIFHKNEQETIPLFKGVRIHRTGSQEAVHKRILLRVQAAYDRCDDWLRSRSQSTRAAIEKPEFKGLRTGPEYTESLTVIDRRQYGKRFLFIMENDKKEQYIYWSERDVLRPNEMYAMRFYVSKLTSFKGVKQKEIISCRGKRIIK